MVYNNCSSPDDRRARCEKYRLSRFYRVHLISKEMDRMTNWPPCRWPSPPVWPPARFPQGQKPPKPPPMCSPLPLPTLPPRTSRPRKRLLRKNPPPKLPRTLWKKRLPRAPRNLPLRSRKPPPPGMRRSCLPCPGRARWWWTCPLQKHPQTRPESLRKRQKIPKMPPIPLRKQRRMPMLPKTLKRLSPQRSPLPARTPHSLPCSPALPRPPYSPAASA